MLTDKTESIESYNRSEIDDLMKANMEQKRGASVKRRKKKEYLNESSLTINNDNSVTEIDSFRRTKTKIQEIYFSLDKEILPYDKSVVLSACPSIAKYLSRLDTGESTITINLPHWVQKNDLLEYFFYYKNGIALNDNKEYYKIILKMCDFFENYELLEKIIQHKIINTLNNESALSYLIDSFEVIENTKEETQGKMVWYELFIVCKEHISIYLYDYIQKEKKAVRDKMLNLKVNLLEDIILQYLRYFYKPELSVDFELYYFLAECKRGNIFEMIINYALVNTASYGKDIIDNNDFPFFEYYFDSFDKTLSFELELPPLKYNEELFMHFITSYNKARDTFSLNVKLRRNEACPSPSPLSLIQKKFDCFTVKTINFFYFYDNDESNVTNVVKNIVVNSKGSANVVNIYPMTKRERRKVSVYAQINYIQSFLFTFLLKNLDMFCKNEKVQKFPIHFIKIISSVQNHLSPTSFFNLILTWLQDETNLTKDNVALLIKEIQWKKVPTKHLMIFIMKYAKFIEKINLEKEFLKELLNTDLNKKIFESAKEVNYYELLKEKNELLLRISKGDSPMEDLSMSSIYKMSEESFVSRLLEQAHIIEYEISSNKKTDIKSTVSTSSNERRIMKKFLKNPGPGSKVGNKMGKSAQEPTKRAEKVLPKKMSFLSASTTKKNIRSTKEVKKGK